MINSESKRTFPKTIGIVGAGSRIGTTTQALQIVKCLNLHNKKSLYIESNNNNYVSNLKYLYTSANFIDEKTNKVEYKGTELLGLSPYTYSISDLDYDCFVIDYGHLNLTNTNAFSIAENDVFCIVCGAKPNEYADLSQILQNPILCKKAYFIFSFCSSDEKNDIQELMEYKSNDTIFAPYTPDAFEYLEIGTYNRIFKFHQNAIDKRAKKRFFNKHKRSE